MIIVSEDRDQVITLPESIPYDKFSIVIVTREHSILLKCCENHTILGEKTDITMPPNSKCRIFGHLKDIEDKSTVNWTLKFEG